MGSFGLDMMKRLILYIFICLPLFSQGYKQKVEKRLYELYGENIELNFKKLEIPSDAKKTAEKSVRQHFFRPDLYSWKLKINDEQKIVILDNVLGKVQPITFLVVYNSSLKVEHVEVMKYRESQGFEVGNKSFLKQFEGKSNSSDFSVGSGLDGISGATISVNSMSRGIHKLSLIVPYISEQFQ